MTTTETTEERFWPKVRKSSGCWIWTGATSRAGYGLFKFRGRSSPAHRVSYVLENGEIPDGLFVCHRCDNPPCVRPDHLYAGTALRNSLDAKDRNRAALGVFERLARSGIVLPMPQAQYLTTGQAAQRLGLSSQRVKQLADAGRLTCERTPLGRLFDAESVEREAESRGLTGSGQPPEVRQ